MVFTLIRDLLGDRLDCPRHRRDAEKHRHPFSASTGAPGPHDFTSAPASFVGASHALRRRRGHRIPASRIVTTARNAPLIEAGCA
jgi:hypothetical protein